MGIHPIAACRHVSTVPVLSFTSSPLLFPPLLQGAVNSIYCLPSEGFATGSADGTVCLWDSSFSFVTQLDLRKALDGYPTLQVRSVCWDGGRLLAGTRDSEVFQVSLQSRDSPACVMQVSVGGRGGDRKGEKDGRGREGRGGVVERGERKMWHWHLV